jgi:uncharacterized damage-inducible protein DinB
MDPKKLFRPWNLIRSDLLRLLSKFSEEELLYTPAPHCWTVGETFLHIAECEDYWINALVRRELALDLQYAMDQYPDARAIRKHLEFSHECSTPFIETLKEPDLERIISTPDGETLTLYEILLHVIEHEVHHRGELSLMLGLLGRRGLDV